MADDYLEAFIDDFSLFGNSFEACLTNLESVLDYCKQKTFLLNWKNTTLVRKDIVLGHSVSSKGMEIDKVKVKYISKILISKTIKDACLCLRHACFYRKFLMDFSNIVRLLSQLFS